MSRSSTCTALRGGSLATNCLVASASPRIFAFSAADVLVRYSSASWPKWMGSVNPLRIVAGTNVFWTTPRGAAAGIATGLLVCISPLQPHVPTQKSNHFVRSIIRTIASGQSRQDRQFRIIPTASECGATRQLQRKSTKRSPESCLTSPSYVWRKANEHSLRLGCSRPSKTECRDRSEDSFLNRIEHTDHHRVARLLP